MELGEIEHKISCNEITIHQVFTQMKQHIIDRNKVLDDAISEILNCNLVIGKRIRRDEAVEAIAHLKRF